MLLIVGIFKAELIQRQTACKRDWTCHGDATTSLMDEAQFLPQARKRGRESVRALQSHKSHTQAITQVLSKDVKREREKKRLSGFMWLINSNKNKSFCESRYWNKLESVYIWLWRRRVTGTMMRVTSVPECTESRSTDPAAAGKN